MFFFTARVDQAIVARLGAQLLVAACNLEFVQNFIFCVPFNTGENVQALGGGKAGEHRPAVDL